jgi:hypothetical protein
MLVPILLVIALVCFVLAALGTTPPRVSLTPLGLAFVVAAMLVPLIR